VIKLTKRQQQVLEIIKDNIEETGYPPTRAEIANQLGFRSANAAEEHLKALARKGAIEIVPGASRGIKLPANDEDAGIPIVGQVAAGYPILAQQNIEDYCQLPNDFFKPAADYFLRVKGMSMKDVGILDGDLLAVHKTTEVRNGQIVVARIDEDVTVKRFQRKGNKVSLFPENNEFQAIVVDLRAQSFAIEGLGVGIVRR
jgi:repressor LexA